MTDQNDGPTASAGSRLAEPAHILLGVTGSVAAKLTPRLYQALSELGQVAIMATQASLYFWRPESGWIDPDRVWTDQREWPGPAYLPDQPVPHIALGDWADILVIAPLTANTLTKMTLGLADNLLTCAYCAWPVGKPVIIAPAMNTRMWQNPQVRRHLLEVASRCWHHQVPPVAKRLACGTTGVGALAEIDEIVRVTALELGLDSAQP